MAWLQHRRPPCRIVVAVFLSLVGVASARESADPVVAPGAAPASATTSLDDTGRIYFSVDTGFHFTLDRQFAGDVEIDPPSGVDWDLGGGVGYNITRNWGVELQVLGIDPDLHSASRGTIREISVLNVVPAVRYRWPLGDGRWMPYVTGGVGISSVDIHDEERAFDQAKTSSTTVVGSLSAGFDYFLTENIAAGVETRYMIHPNQDATVIYANSHGGGATRYTDRLNLTSVSLLAHLKFFPGQQAGDGTDRTFFLADHGPFDTDELRVYGSGLFGYDFLFDRDGGAGVKIRDKGGDFNLTKGGALGVNFDEHWGAEVVLLVTPFNVRLASGGPRFQKLNVFEIVPRLRYRWPFLDGRLVPFVTAGLGASDLEANDQRPQVEFQKGRGQVVVYPRYTVDSPALVGSVSAGVEYFLNHHLSIGVDVPLHFYPAQDSVLRRTGHLTRTGTANFSGVLALLQLKAYLP
jgi:opacity protein-like surface antigen